MNAPFARTKLEQFGKLLTEYQRRKAKGEQSQRGWYDGKGVRQGGLMSFIRYFWHLLEPDNALVEGWALYAIIEHLEAVTFGEIKRLLITVPPGFMKSLCTDVFWPAWEWGPMKMSYKRYVAFSYSASLTERDNERFRTVIVSNEYQRLYGPIQTKVDAGERINEVGIANKTIIKVMNNRRGWKLASSIGGVGTGERGDGLILDDAHNIKEAESETVRTETVRWFRESMSDRLNNMATGFIVVIMQRSHEEDVAGIILTLGLPYTHLMIPMEYDVGRQVAENGEPYSTEIGWSDPRYNAENPDSAEGELAWEERFPTDVVNDIKTVKGIYAYAGQYQQSPMPRGGGLFKREWWQLWEPDDGKFPIFDFVVASLDGAFTEDEENDPSALSVWGTFVHPESKKHCIMLIHAWRKHLAFSASRFERLQLESVIEGQRWLPENIVPGMDETEVKRRNARFKRRTMGKWGLVEWVQDTCATYKVDLLLIENKATGRPAAQEIANRYGLQRFGIQMCEPRGDKVARALSVQPTFAQGLVYAPEREWSELIISEMEVFPKGARDDLTDTATQVMKYFRDAGLAMTDEEVTHEEYQRGLHRPQRKPLYPV